MGRQWMRDDELLESAVTHVSSSVQKANYASYVFKTFFNNSEEEFIMMRDITKRSKLSTFLSGEYCNRLDSGGLEYDHTN